MKSCGKCGSRYLDGNGCGLAANDPQETRETRTYVSTIRLKLTRPRHRSSKRSFQFDSNVILVDWSNGANMLNYIQAVANARLVGTEMARLTTALTQLQLSHPSKIHALGYSLGAQVISYMANNITGLHRITGLKIMMTEIGNFFMSGDKIHSPQNTSPITNGYELNISENNTIYLH